MIRPGVSDETDGPDTICIRLHAKPGTSFDTADISARLDQPVRTPDTWRERSARAESSLRPDLVA
jgi:hypothetical protein